MKQILFLGAIVIGMASCSLQKQTSNTSKTLGIYGAGVIQKPVITHLKMNPQKISSSYSGSGTQGIDYHKSQAIAKAMSENKADVIIEPAYEITSTASSVSIITTGYAGSYENFRPMVYADTLLVEAGIIDYNNGPGDTPAPKPVKKKSKAGWVLLALLIGGAAAASGGL
ncbi:MAG: hypothetical protein EOO06_18455 [Chitinophagaceae bacterium]|nr:MAG: hypothetical protein EOO06_18455 [Chitinophagaceae bacterium]